MHGDNKVKSRAAIALALCFCVLVLTSVLAVKSSIDKITNSGSTVTDKETAVSEKQETAAKTPVVDSKDGAQNSGSSDTSPEPAAYIAPIKGDIQLKYSMDSLVYSNTLDQYMTHPGIDIHADLSQEVTAVADGTVTRVYTDDRYGVTVCITHGDGVVSVYSNLAEQGLAETGDEVSQGQTIGNIGDTALFESLDDSHLHFEMKKDGNNADPGEFIKSLKAE